MISKIHVVLFMYLANISKLQFWYIGFKGLWFSIPAKANDNTLILMLSIIFFITLSTKVCGHIAEGSYSNVLLIVLLHNKLHLARSNVLTSFYIAQLHIWLPLFVVLYISGFFSWRSCYEYHCRALQSLFCSEEVRQSR